MYFKEYFETKMRDEFCRTEHPQEMLGIAVDVLAVCGMWLEEREPYATTSISALEDARDEVEGFWGTAG